MSPPQPLSSGRRRLAYATGGFGLAVNAMILFLLPLRATELGISVGVIGLLLGSKAATEAVVGVPLGGFMDRVGTRRAFLIGTGLTAVIAVGYVFASSTVALFALQVVLGAVRPLAWVGSQSYVAGLRRGPDRAYDTGRFSFAANVAQIVAPLTIGGAAQLFGVRQAFTVLAAYALLFFLVGLALPDAGREAQGDGDRRSFSSAVGLLRLPGIQVAMMLTFVRLWIPSAWTAFYPLELVSSGVPEAVAGSVVSTMGVVATLVTLASGRISRLGTAEGMTAVALGIAAAGLALSPFLASVPAVYLPAAMVGIGQGVSLPLLIVIVSNGAPADQRGLALGLRSSINQVSAAVAPSVVAPLIGALGLVVGFPAAAALAAVLLAAAALRGAHLQRDELTGRAG